MFEKLNRITSVENGQLHFQLNIYESESKYESESERIFVNLHSGQTFTSQRLDIASATWKV